ncbi:hypothetical protein Btru_017572 [Bulinus truncatus]|nr:hypothetical protein Btru_017572 [Bulinus truncatus]
MLKLYQGDKGFTAEWESTPQSTVASSINSVGYIMVFAFTGWLLCFSIVLVTVLIASLYIYYNIKTDQMGAVLTNVGGVLSVLVASVILTVVLTPISKKFLLQRKLNPSAKNPPFNVDNRKLYEIINYFYLYVSMTRSFYSCCLRFILTVVFSALSQGRLDTTIYSKDKLKFDTAHGTYIAMLRLDNAHNNPCMRLFAHLLWGDILVARLRNSGGRDVEIARLIATLNCSELQGICVCTMALLEFYKTQYIMLIPASLIILFLAFLEKRNVGRNVCGGRPALIMPIPSIDGYENRAAYAMAFGVSLNTVLRTILFNDFLGFEAMVWVKTLYSLFQALIVCLITFPFCATISSRYRAAGAIINIMYSLSWLVIQIMYLVDEEPQAYLANVNVILDALVYLPYFICQSVLILYCCYILYRCYRCKSYVSQKIPGLVRPHQVEHVRWVFRKSIDKNYIASKIDSKISFVSLMRKSRRLRLITNFPFFKYPTKIFICIVFQLTVMCVLTVGFAYVICLVNALQQYSTNLIIRILFYFFPQQSVEVLNIIKEAMVVALIISNLNSLVNNWMFYRNYRYHILKLYQGDKGFTADWESSPQSTMISSMNSIGYIMVFATAGWVLCYLALFLPYLITRLYIYYIIKTGKLDEVLENVGVALCVFVVGVILTLVLTLISKKFLLQRKLNTNEKNPPFNVDNRKLYEVINYFYLYVSMTRSLYSCCWRFILTAVFSVQSLGRLDTTIFSRDREKFDTAHGTYIAMLRLDNAHNNPCMRLFAHFLWGDILVARLRNSGGSDVEIARLIATLNHRQAMIEPPGLHAQVSGVYVVSPNVDTKSKLAKSRWSLAYTLVRNPQLASLRRKGVSDQSENGTDGINLPVIAASNQFNYSSLA